MKKKRILAGMIFALTITVNGCQSNQSAKKTAETTASPLPTVAVVDLPEDSYTTLKDNVYTATGGALQVTVPEDWTISDEDATVLVAGKEEDTKDCLTVQISQKDNKFSEYTVEDFEKIYSKTLNNYEAESYEKTTVGGLEAGCLTYSFSTDTEDVQGYEYFIDGNYTYVLNFTDVSGNLKDKIPEILKQVKICK